MISNTLLIQWGYSVMNGSGTKNFPITFTTFLSMAAFITCSSSSHNWVANKYPHTITTSGYSYATQAVNNAGTYFIAVGTKV